LGGALQAPAAGRKVTSGRPAATSTTTIPSGDGATTSTAKPSEELI
jgi:hypothetical protein